MFGACLLTMLPRQGQKCLRSRRWAHAVAIEATEMFAIVADGRQPCSWAGEAQLLCCGQGEPVARLRWPSWALSHWLHASCPDAFSRWLSWPVASRRYSHCSQPSPSLARLVSAAEEDLPCFKLRCGSRKYFPWLAHAQLLLFPLAPLPPLPWHEAVDRLASLPPCCRMRQCGLPCFPGREMRQLGHPLSGPSLAME